MLKRICACYNSRTYGSRWVLVCPAVFKTVAGGEELPRWVRFPHTLANGNRSGSVAPVFVYFNPSVSYAASSPAGEPFGIVQAPPKSCPRLWGKCRGASRDERGTARRCQAVLAFPLSLTSFDSSPAGGGAFWCSINSKPKASLSREVDFAKQKTEGFSLP